MAAFLRLYGTTTVAGTHIGIPMVKAGSDDLAHAADWTPAAGDVKVSLDGATQTNIATLPAFTNGQWVYQFSSTETACKSLRVEIVDAATKAVKDNFFVVETYGDVNALHPYLDSTLIIDGGAGVSTYDRTTDNLASMSERSVTWVAAEAVSEGTLAAVGAPSGGFQTVTLDPTDVSDTDFYKGSLIYLKPGTPGGRQQRLVLSQAGRVLTIPQFTTANQPDTTTQYEMLVGNQSGDTPSQDQLASAPVSIAAGGINAAAFAADTDVYTAKAWMVDDNTGTTDRWIVAWYKNGAPVTTGITVPTIQIVKASDGTNLLAATAMTQIGSTGSYKYDSASRVVDGAAYLVVLVATIASATRTWYQPFGVRS